MPTDVGARTAELRTLIAKALTLAVELNLAAVAIRLEQARLVFANPPPSKRSE